MYERYDLRPLAKDGGACLGFGEGFTPWLFATHYFGAVTAAHLGDPVGKISGRKSTLGAGLDEVSDSRFHAGAAGAGKRECQRITGPKDFAQTGADAFTDFKKERIQIANHWLVHRRIDAILNLSWAGTDRNRRGGAKETIRFSVSKCFRENDAKAACNVPPCSR